MATALFLQNDGSISLRALCCQLSPDPVLDAFLPSDSSHWALVSSVDLCHRSMGDQNRGLHQGLVECVSFKEAGKSEDEILFNRERTLKIIELYAKYKPKVGTFEVKTMKRLWEVIARDISNFYKISISASKCENKFRVLERKYKNIVDNNTKTGRGRKVFEFEDEMDQIFKKKKQNIRPTILLFRKTITEMSKDKGIKMSIANEQCPSSRLQNLRNESSVTLSIPDSPKPIRRPLQSKVWPSSAFKKRNDILLELKNDLKLYYEKKVEYAEKRQEIMERKLADSEKRTALLERLVLAQEQESLR